MKLTQYIAGLREATTVDELEKAIQTPFVHPYHGRTWTSICKARIEIGISICETHPNGKFVPRFDGRLLTVCGESFAVKKGLWHSAGVRSKAILKRNGLSSRAAHRVWDCWTEYPHRCIGLVEAALKGELSDPVMDTPFLSYTGGNPVKITVEENDADEYGGRATMPCKCGGTLFDWGCGFSDGFTFVNWHCNYCNDVYAEYVTSERFSKIRQSPITNIPYNIK